MIICLTKTSLIRVTFCNAYADAVVTAIALPVLSYRRAINDAGKEIELMDIVNLFIFMGSYFHFLSMQFHVTFCSTIS